MRTPDDGPAKTWGCILDAGFIALNLTVFAAALLQAASGIGFGLMAGPVMLLVLGAGSAIQLSALLSLLIAVILIPSLLKDLNRLTLRHFVIGSCVGIPAGAVAYALVSIVTLKLLAAVVVLVMCASITFSWPKSAGHKSDGGRADIMVGTLSGLMSATLAMPGPAPAAWMTLKNETRDSVRSTILTLFLFSYPAAIACQAWFAGITVEPFRQCLLLAPATIVGVFVGRGLVKRIDQKTFRRIISVILLATGIALLADVGARWIS